MKITDKKSIVETLGITVHAANHFTVISDGAHANIKFGFGIPEVSDVRGFSTAVLLDSKTVNALIDVLAESTGHYPKEPRVRKKGKKV